MATFPLQIDPTHFSRQSNLATPPMGPIKRGTNLYWVLQYATGASRMGIYKGSESSILAGTAPPEQDATNSPWQGNVALFTAFDDPDNDAIHVCLYGGTGEIRIASFSTATDTWGAAGVTQSVSANMSAFWRRLDGTFVALINSAGNWDAYTYNGSAWTTVGSIRSVSSTLYSGTRDSLGVYYGVCFESGAFRLYAINAALSVTVTTIASVSLYSGAAVPNVYMNGTGLRGVFGYRDSVNFYPHVVAFECPTRTAPVFTTYTVYETTDTLDNIEWTYTVAANDSSWFAFWSLTNYAGGIANLDEIQGSEFDGVSAWSAPIVYYDEIANPPVNSVPDQTDQFVHTLEVVQLSDGTWLLTTALETKDGETPDDLHCTGFLIPYPIPGLSLACPVTNTGTVGTPYSSFLVASGGTEPYTYAITVGPLPAGLTLNSSTGEISGTPLAVGTYPYTAQVTDADSNTATADCSITITQPLGGSCPANNTIAVGRPYSGQIDASGGTPPYTFALTGGAFPPGITLNTSTGVVSGTSTVAGSYSWEVTITDADGSETIVSCGTTIGCPPTPSLLLELTGDTPSVGVIIIPTTKSLL